MTKIPSTRLVERAAETLGDDLSRLQKGAARVVEHLVKDSGRLTKRARYTLRNGAGSLMELEDRMTNSIQARPLAYILVTLGLASIVGLKILLDRQNRSEEDV